MTGGEALLSGGGVPLNDGGAPLNDRGASPSRPAARLRDGAGCLSDAGKLLNN